MVERILSISNIQAPGRILDIGCGIGYHATAFAHKGFEVFAFDPGQKYLSPLDKVRNWGQLSDCFALSEKWTDQIYFHEHSLENRVVIINP